MTTETILMIVVLTILFLSVISHIVKHFEADISIWRLRRTADKAIKKMNKNRGIK